MLRDLVIDNGQANTAGSVGGGIFNVGEMTLEDVTVSDSEANSGGGIYNTGDLTLIRSLVAGNNATYMYGGGGIYQGADDGVLTLIDSTVSDNDAPNGSGGGINGLFLQGPVRIYRSTISGNHAFGTGGIVASDLVMNGSTVSGNTSGGGATALEAVIGSATIVNSTIAGNGNSNSALATDRATVTIGNSIVADNPGGNCGGDLDFVSVGYNITDSNGVACGITQSSDRVNTSPGLGPLQDNGGPTLTMLPSGAGALRVVPRLTTLAGISVCPGYDQRLRARPQPGQTKCAAGAVEPGATVGVPPAITSSSSATVDIGTAFTVPVTTSGTPVPILSATGLPAGVTFTDNGNGTGTIAGTSSAAGNHVLTLHAWNGTDPPAEETFTLTVRPLPTIAVDDVTQVEGNAGTSTLTFTLTRSGPTHRSATVKVATVAGTAAAGSDFTAVPLTTVTFAVGQTTRTVDVDVTGDTEIEPNETFKLHLSAPVRATISDADGTATLTNDDSATLAVDDISLAEGNSGTATATFTLTRSGATGGTSSVKVATVDGTATAGSDYTAVPLTTVSFAAGQATRTVNVDVTGDTAIEPNETFRLHLSAPVRATISDADGTATITNDDSASTSVNDVTVAEGDSGTTTATFTLTRSGATGSPASVKVATVGGTATAGTDYVAVPLTTVSFAVGQSTRTVNVTINGDTAIEPDETFNLILSAPVGTTISDNSGTATITNDEVVLAVDDVSVVEGDSGTASAVFTLTRSGGTAGTSSVKVATANGTATAGTDYTAVPLTTVTFTPGQTTKTVTVSVTGDAEVEASETLRLNLSAPVGATIGDASGTATIVNDDAAYIAVDDAVVVEGSSGTKSITFTLTRSGRTGGTSSVKVATANDTATAGSDYTALPPTVVSFAAGQTTRSVTVTVQGDTAIEDDETLKLNLSVPVRATIIDTSATATILTDDGASVSVGDAKVTEGNAGTTALTFTLTRSLSLDGTASVDVATANGTATAGSDYVALAPATVTFSDGEATKSVVVQVKGDAVAESNETFKLTLTGVDVFVADAEATGTIVDNEGPIEAAPSTYFSVDDPFAEEGNVGGSTALATITRSGDVSGASSVHVTTIDGSTDQYDFDPVDTTVTFTAGQTTKTVPITIFGDTYPEEFEAFGIALSAPVGGVVSDDLGFGVILNDDLASIGVQDAAVVEGDAGTKTVIVTLTRSGSTGGTSDLVVTTASGTATAGSDFVTKAATIVTFSPGQTTRTVVLTVKGDPTVEPTETFKLNLSDPMGGTIVDTFGLVSIINDD
ncbi:hypothetical protein F0U44_05975 [Nocardioides humilatus]|uniref:Calx-beta domain-containing protein n=1 Tax=Nocardioides humilatus TaxID=2607660 RepID=A0A5B1LM09_9ACTN|nr:Calx-beta domain-containing protein [Nocardioides humilatus]KAA1421815.1 hypothetical protein F0U44_05975 [Nocardioides humilatus]